MDSCRNNIAKIIKEACTLYKNGQYYQSSGELEGAIISYSCCASILHTLFETQPCFQDREALKNMVETAGLESDVLCGKFVRNLGSMYQCSLGQVEGLQDELKKRKSIPSKEDDDEKDWSKVCTLVKPLVFSKGSPDCLFFNDIAGLNKEKKMLKISMIYPLMYKNLYPKISKGLLLYGPPGTGKCVSPDEKIVMYDGTIKEAQDIIPGDLLMGDDSTSRTVLSTCSGEDEMFKIIPNKGESFVVNQPHILSLVSSKAPRVKPCQKENRYKVIWAEDGNIKSKTFWSYNEESLEKATDFKEQIRYPDKIDIPLDEYLKKPKSWKTHYKGYRVGAEWVSKKVPLDPYVLGVWLGDGSKDYPLITNVDSEIIDYLDEIFENMDLKMKPLKNQPITYSISRDKEKTNVNGFWKAIRDLNLVKNKHIPLIYKANSRDIRLQVLAGIIDTDGYLTCNCYEIVQKRKGLIDDIAFIARSLGFCATIKEVTKVCTNAPGGPKPGLYYQCYISGEGLDEIPTLLSRKQAKPRKQIKDVLRFGFKVEPLGKGKYCGFTLDRNSRFLLKDFTVTHNTYTVKAAVNELQQINPNVGVLFFTPTAATLKGKFVGETEKRIVEQFTCAARAACQCTKRGNKKYISVIFMDEMDSIAPERSTDETGMAASTVNTLLQMMDGVQSFENVSVIAATNYPWKLDSAILRRFDTQILLDVPDVNQINDLLNLSFSNFIKLSIKEDTSCKRFSDITGVEEEKKTSESDQLKCDIECDPRDSTNKYRYLELPYSDFNLQFQNESTTLMALSQEMNEKNYSNSDVDKVFKKAANYCAEAAIDANLFYKPGFSPGDIQDFYISSLTLPKDQRYREALNKEYLRNFLPSLFSNKTQPDNTAFTKIPRGNKIKPTPRFKDDFYLVNTPKFAHINGPDGRKYTNIKLLLDKDARILLSDIQIKDVYVHIPDPAPAGYYSKAKEWVYPEGENYDAVTGMLDSKYKDKHRTDSRIVSVIFTKELTIKNQFSAKDQQEAKSKVGGNVVFDKYSKTVNRIEDILSKNLDTISGILSIVVETIPKREKRRKKSVLTTLKIIGQDDTRAKDLYEFLNEVYGPKEINFNFIKELAKMEDKDTLEDKYQFICQNVDKGKHFIRDVFRKFPIIIPKAEVGLKNITFDDKTKSDYLLGYTDDTKWSDYQTELFLFIDFSQSSEYNDFNEYKSSYSRMESEEKERREKAKGKEEEEEEEEEEGSGKTLKIRPRIYKDDEDSLIFDERKVYKYKIKGIHGREDQEYQEGELIGYLDSTKTYIKLPIEEIYKSKFLTVIRFPREYKDDEIIVKRSIFEILFKDSLNLPLPDNFIPKAVNTPSFSHEIFYQMVIRSLYQGMINDITSFIDIFKVYKLPFSDRKSPSDNDPRVAKMKEIRETLVIKIADKQISHDILNELYYYSIKINVLTNMGKDTDTVDDEYKSIQQLINYRVEQQKLLKAFENPDEMKLFNKDIYICVKFDLNDEAYGNTVFNYQPGLIYGSAKLVSRLLTGVKDAAAYVVKPLYKRVIGDADDQTQKDYLAEIKNGKNRTILQYLMSRAGYYGFLEELEADKINGLINDNKIDSESKSLIRWVRLEPSIWGKATEFVAGSALDSIIMSGLYFFSGMLASLFGEIFVMGLTAFVGIKFIFYFIYDLAGYGNEGFNWFGKNSIYNYVLYSLIDNNSIIRIPNKHFKNKESMTLVFNEWLISQYGFWKNIMNMILQYAGLAGGWTFTLPTEVDPNKEKIDDNDLCGPLNLEYNVNPRKTKEIQDRMKNLNLLPSYLISAIADTQSTYNPELGKQSKAYNEDRTKFLEDLSKKTNK